MSNVPDAWEDEWANVADAPAPSQSLDAEPKKVSAKVTKAQKRAQQAEFNRQIWAEAEGPKQPNYFLESRNVVPHRQEFKPPPTLLSRKGPITQIQRPPPQPALSTNPTTTNNATVIPTAIATNLAHLRVNDESSEDEDEEAARILELEERKAKASRDREEKQRKYEERRLELFGPQYHNSNSNHNTNTQSSTTVPNTTTPSVTRSGTSSPASSTPPHSRSSTPNQRGGGRRGRGRGGGVGGNGAGAGAQPTPHHHNQPRILQQREVYDPSYLPKPNSTYIQRTMGGVVGASGDFASRHDTSLNAAAAVQPMRAPKGPDGSGRGGFGFVARGGHATQNVETHAGAGVPSV